MDIVPLTVEATPNRNTPVAPFAAVQVPFVVLPCVKVTVTASVTVTPDVTNDHVPDQLPETSSAIVGLLGLLPHAAASIKPIVAISRRARRLPVIVRTGSR